MHFGRKKTLQPLPVEFSERVKTPARGTFELDDIIRHIDVSMIGLFLLEGRPPVIVIHNSISNVCISFFLQGRGSRAPQQLLQTSSGGRFNVDI